ncbi:hypothetical protein KUTeg_022204 [Tegillarca granosa]|uniref:Uncharacterized protein n=1 Tax=Tegillarca granosa TaxID=220873 RepID=A0ABQ9EB00_TEGGR|nr:hypothetical protein KUTeg_022204 [Tegillarca granosa]
MKTWKYGTCVDRVCSHSYIVDIGGHLYRRNRKYLTKLTILSQWSISRKRNRTSNVSTQICHSYFTFARLTAESNTKSNRYIAL